MGVIAPVLRVQRTGDVVLENTRQARFPLKLADRAMCLLLGELGQTWGVGEALHCGVHEAGVAQVMEPKSHFTHTFPLQRL